jgi:hypothetical protein
MVFANIKKTHVDSFCNVSAFGCCFLMPKHQANRLRVINSKNCYMLIIFLYKQEEGITLLKLLLAFKYANVK